jgi:segregation and condensation protein B
MGTGDQIPQPGELIRIVEAILFSSSRPISLKRLTKKLEEFTELEISAALQQLVQEYRDADRAMEIVEAADGYQIRTKIAFKEWVKRFSREKDPGLTKAMLETLSIVAYKQPITKRDLDLLRGVDSVWALKQLLQRRLVEIAGRAEEPGRPMVFRTTNRFLEVFGLKHIRDLPTIKEIEAIHS